MKHIVIDARESGTSTGRYIDKLIEYLHRLRPKFNITILTKPSRVEFIRSIAPKFEVKKSSVKEFTFAEQIKLLGQIKRLKPDLVHFGMTQQPILCRGKKVTTIHDLTTARFNNPAKNKVVFWIKQRVYEFVIKLVAKKSATVITPSEFVKDDVARFAKINSRKIAVTYEAADNISDSPEPIGELENKQFIMYIGRPTPHKNLDRLVEAFMSLRQRHPELHLVLAGKKDELYWALEKDLKKRGIKNVLFTGFVSEGQLRWLYENTACYVFPSLSEGFGLPGLEAMIQGAPVASSNATCLPEIYGEGAEYFDPKNVEEMADVIEKIIVDKKLQKKLITNGKKQASKYSWEKTARQTLEIYEDILN